MPTKDLLLDLATYTQGTEIFCFFSSELSNCLCNFSPSYVCSVCSVDVRSGNVTLLGVLWFTEGRICIEIDR